MSSVLILAAEASSNTYAYKIIEGLLKHSPQLKVFGVGDQKLETLGVERLGHAEDMAIVGAVEIIKHYGRLKGIFNSLVARAEKEKPKFAILMDYPEFNLQLAKQLSTRGIPVFYYISPQVWAWRQGRVKTIKKYCSKVYLIFPFEVPFYEKHQVPNQFVGHPLLDDISPELLSPSVKELRQSRYGLGPDEIALGLMPGSRRGELEMNFPTQLETARILSKKYPQIRVFILAAPTFTKEFILTYLEDFKTPYTILQDESFKMIQLVDIMLVASGTATLQVGLMHVPMVIMYKVKWLTAVFVRTFIRGSKYLGLVNLILGKEAVPERFQEDAQPEKLAALLEKYVTDLSYRESVVSDLKDLTNHLGSSGANQRVIDDLVQYL